MQKKQVGVAYESVAPLYDDLMQHVDYEGWFKHYMALVSLSRIAVSEILELGCGTGIMTQLFADYVPVTGVDSSEAMLRMARKKSYERAVHFECADLRDFDLGRRFPLAVAVFDVFNCVRTFDELCVVLSNVSRHLLDGARILFDVNTPFAFESQLFDEDVIDEEAHYKHRWRGIYDAHSQCIEVRMHFSVDGEDFEEVHVQRAHTQAEIRRALKGAGFGRVHFMDANSFGQAGAHCDRWLVCATKRASGWSE